LWIIAGFFRLPREAMATSPFLFSHGKARAHTTKPQSIEARAGGITGRWLRVELSLSLGG
jgi:hypothetical protein